MSASDVAGDRKRVGIEYLIDETWRIYRDASESCVIKPAIPILYFGDSAKHLQSTYRILTVGLNPSRAEFPDGGLQRFPAARNLARVQSLDEQRTMYQNALDTYFITDPYATWFNCYEPILRGLGGSYYGDTENTALHTDICSPLATDPTWSGLLPQVRSRLEQDGARLWRELVGYFSPDIIVASIAAEHIRKIDSLPISRWDTIYTIERENPYHVKALTKMLANGKRTLIVFGPAAQKPFGKVSTQCKLDIGRSVLQRRLEIELNELTQYKEKSER